MPYLPTLRLFFPGGVYNDYRLRQGRVEFRTNEGSWITLDDSEIQLHLRFDTEVARWINRYLIEMNPHNRGKLSELSEMLSTSLATKRA